MCGSKSFCFILLCDAICWEKVWCFHSAVLWGGTPREDHLSSLALYPPSQGGPGGLELHWGAVLQPAWLPLFHRAPSWLTVLSWPSTWRNRPAVSDLLHLHPHWCGPTRQFAGPRLPFPALWRRSYWERWRQRKWRRLEDLKDFMGQCSPGKQGSETNTHFHFPIMLQ